MRIAISAALAAALLTWSTSAFGVATDITTIAGAETQVFGSPNALDYKFDDPIDVAAVPSTGNTWFVYVVDQDVCQVKKVTLPAGTIVTAAGTGVCASSGSGLHTSAVAAASTPFGHVTALAATFDNKILIGDRGGLSEGRIQQLDPATGLITTVAGSGTCGTVPSTTGGAISATTAGICNVYGLAAHPGTAGRFLIVSRSGVFVPDVFEVAAGNLKRVATGDGACGSTALTHCFGFARDALYAGSGNEFLVSDSTKKTIHKFDTSNQALAPVKVAGGGAGDPGEGGTAAAAALKGPLGLARSYDGGYYFSDQQFTGAVDDACRVRKVSGFTASSTITTAAGNGSCVSQDGVRLDGIPATDSPVIAPQGLALYGGGLLIAEQFGKTNPNSLGGTQFGRVRQVDRTTLLTQPPAVTNATQITFSWAALEPTAAFECNWVTPDGPIFYASCPNPKLLPASPSPNFVQGGHSFTPNVSTSPKDPTPDQVQWIEDFNAPATFGLLAPAAGATQLSPSPTFSWQPTTDPNGIDRYELWIDGAKSRDAGTATQAQPGAPLSEGTHNWFVKAFDEAGNPRDSESRTFTSSSPPAASFTMSPNPALVGRSVTFDGSGSSDPDGSIARYEWDLDGDGSFETDGGAAPTAARAYDSPQTINVSLRVTDGVGLTTTATQELRITSSSAPGGQLGVTVNNGAQYTRSPDVAISANFPATITGMLFSNDGGFLAPATVAPQREVKWKLDSSGPERLPKIVYVRFLTGPFVSETHTDDIILDETPPKVDTASVLPAAGGAASIAKAKARRWTVKVKATDSNSGVARVQVTSTKKKPGKLIAYKRKLTVKSAARPKFIRARDRAGNFSPWRSAKRR